MRRAILSIVLGSLTLALLMLAAWMTAQNYDHNGPDTPLSRALSPFSEWGFAAGAAFVHLVGENVLSVAMGTVIAFGAPSLLYGFIYFMCFTTFSYLRHHRL